MAIFNSVSCHARRVLPEAKRRRGDFFENPKGADLAGQWGHGITFAKNLITFVRNFIVLFDFERIRFHGIKIQENSVIFNDTFTKHFPEQGATQLRKR